MTIGLPLVKTVYPNHPFHQEATRWRIGYAHGEKVQSVRTALEQINIEKAARLAGVPASTLRYDLHKLGDALPEVLANQKPGPKPRDSATRVSTPSQPTQDASVCPKCDGKVRKNGTYWVLNWFLMLTTGWLGIQKVCLRRRRCKICGHEVVAPERTRQQEARRAWWQQTVRLIGWSRFKLGLPVRKTQWLVGFVYARQVSVGHIERLTHHVGQRAQSLLTRLSQCRQKVAQFLIALRDETFPR